MATAPDPTSTDQIGNLLQCSICKKTVNEPRTLGCFHSFCKRCLEKYVQSQRLQFKGGKKHQFNCPSCKTQFQLRQGETVERFPPKEFINYLQEILRIQGRIQQLFCDHCNGKFPAVCRCVECENFLCQNCLTTHSNWRKFEDHDVLTLEELAKPENQHKAKGKLRCQKQSHGDKEIEFYCNTCQELVCIYCVVLEHPKPDHEFKLIAVVAEQHKEALRKTSAVLQQKSKLGQNALQKIEHATQVLETNAKTSKDRILKQEKEIVEEFTRKIKLKTKVLLNEIDKKHNDFNQKLVKQQNDMKAYVEKVNGSLAFVQNIIEKGGIEDILSLGKEIEVNVSDIEKEEPEVMLPVHYGEIKYHEVEEKTSEILDKINLDGIGKIDCAPVRKPVDPVVAQSLLEKSTILERNIEHAQQLVHWVEDKEFGWQLCYRASQDGWSSGNFHRKCDDVIGPTVTLVKCGTNVFGGYTDQSWKPPGRYFQVNKSSSASFLFSLRNKDNVPSFKCEIKDDKYDKAIYCIPWGGAIFGGRDGGGGDLFISNNANTNRDSSSDLGVTYLPPPGYQPGTPQTKSLLAGSYKFQPTEIEVFRS